MKPHPRIRKTIKWGGAAVTVLLAVVWIGSGWRSVRIVVAKGVAISVADGQVVLERFPGGLVAKLDQGQWFEMNAGGFDYSKPVTYAEPVSNWSYHLSWGMGRIERSAWYSLFHFPLWIPTGLFASVVLAAHVRRRTRAKLGFCPKCSYDRAGIAGDAKCPECGCGGAMPAVPAPPSR